MTVENADTCSYQIFVLFMFKEHYLDPVACNQEQTLKKASSRESVPLRVKNVNGIHKT